MGPILKQEREGRGLGSMLWQRRRKGDLRSMSGLKIKKKKRKRDEEIGTHVKTRKRRRK